MEKYGRSSKVKFNVPYDLAILFLGIYTKLIKRYIHTKTGTGIFIATLFVVIE